MYDEKTTVQLILYTVTVAADVEVAIAVTERKNMCRSLRIS